MTSPEKVGTADKSQLDKFKEAARELECDDDEQQFKGRLGKLVGALATIPVVLLLEGDPPRLLQTLRLPSVPQVGAELEVQTHSTELKVRVTRTQDTVKDEGTLFVNYDHWAAVEPI